VLHRPFTQQRTNPLTIAVHSDDTRGELSLLAPGGLQGLEASRAKMSNLRMALVALGCGALFGSAAGVYVAFTAAPLGEVVAAFAPAPAKAVRIGAHEAPVFAALSVWTKPAP
jgi:hypothetical protein